MPQKEPGFMVIGDEIELDLSPKEEQIVETLARYLQRTPEEVVWMAWQMKAEQTIGKAKYRRWKHWPSEDELPPIPAGLQKLLDELDDDDDS